MTIVDHNQQKVIIPSRRPVRAGQGYRAWGIKLLYYQCGLSATDIAKVFGVSRQTVNYWVGSKDKDKDKDKDSVR